MLPCFLFLSFCSSPPFFFFFFFFFLITSFPFFRSFFWRGPNWQMGKMGRWVRDGAPAPAFLQSPKLTFFLFGILLPLLPFPVPPI
ncbi:uncharacterized protein GGS25DRAFT_476094 [Hypoxylon fragiforme]|uniref:uncharacterized protein n=1 Tax=Hypoxylon fragiforme TaxID=63214 RepID=UPI0020C63635|nr:uncharacterized protein GGS25DRAFT_476094 [Hypoxylon fragiforme]KAI2612601.1 hypothetical protein GGS25DRAFT_476094 [Hypoxylon fragiforme]